MFTINEIVKATSARVVCPGRARMVRSVSIDSRTTRPASVFIAVIGTRCDGHAFIKDAVAKGAACVIVQNPDFFGGVKDLSVLANLCHEVGALLVVAVTEPLSLGLLQPPGQMGADIVIAVDLGSDMLGRRLRNRGETPPSVDGWRGTLKRWLGVEEGSNSPSMLDVMASSINIMQVRIARSRLAGEPADTLISPRVADLGLLDFHRADEAIAEGRVATELMLPMLRSVLEMPA